MDEFVDMHELIYGDLRLLADVEPIGGPWSAVRGCFVMHIEQAGIQQ